jgi:hypothetical protein
LEHDVSENNYKELIESWDYKPLYRSEDDMLWVEEKNVYVEGDIELLPGSSSKDDKT